MLLTLLPYLLKLSVCLALFYAFYYLMLRRLTFHTCNRWYLLLHSVAAFIIPLINLNTYVPDQQLNTVTILRNIPALTGFHAPAANIAPHTHLQWTLISSLNILLITGMALLAIRLLISYLSLRQLRRSAIQIQEQPIRIYHIEKNIIPFCSGNAIFLNQSMQTTEELSKIICHEWVHITQKHQYDILFAELLCLLNWYNPFAWLIRHAIRQNLEYIADRTVLAQGEDPRQYQYLLLKVLNNSSTLPILNYFNFSSLKNRIIMMNKIKTTNKQLFRFLLAIPLLAILLTAFRSSTTPVAGHTAATNKTRYIAFLVMDAQTRQPITNATLSENEPGKKIPANNKGYVALKLNKQNSWNYNFVVSAPGYKNQEVNFSFNTHTRVSNGSSLIAVVGIKKIQALPQDQNPFTDMLSLANPEDALRYDAVKAALDNRYKTEDETLAQTSLKTTTDNLLKRITNQSSASMLQDSSWKGKQHVLFLTIYPLKTKETETYNLSIPGDAARLEKKYGPFTKTN